jgi:hypothetical protein
MNEQCLNRAEVRNMESAICEQAQVGMDDPVKEILGQVIADLVRQNPELRRAILEVVWSCPNNVTAI